MIAIFYLVLQILKLYSYVVIANVIVSWLIAFNVLTDEGLIYANVPPTDTKGRKDIRWAYNAYNRKFI